MALAPGTKLGPYEILSFIGAGGMGEVYKARDTRLGRDVAVKVLPASFAADAERLRRFEQEARAVAALNHPNIVAVHDIGQHDGAPYLVSELLEGESLREILARGPMSHRRAVEYAVQVAHGLAVAHAKNIAHRDLKPDNIFVTRDGRVKILDFGLAKIVEKPVAQADGGMTMTAVAPATDIGVVMGTAGYMSPEQVRGGVADCRTDIFSFGAVLYEMLTGKRAFKRDTAADTMAAILNEEPPELSESGRQIPPVLDRIVTHCLEKAPEQRFQSARDLAFDLESVSTLTGSGGTVAAIKTKQRRRWWSIAAAVAALALIAAIAGWKLSSILQPAVGWQFHQVTFRRGTLDNGRFTPDGQNIVYTAMWEATEPELYTVGANEVGGHPLGIHNARLLAISKNGELAVALAPTRLNALILPGSLARTSDVSAAPRPEIENIIAADYNPQGSDLAIVRYIPDKQVCQLEYPLGKVLYSDGAIDNVRFSPDGRYLAFVTHADGGDDRGRAVILRKSGEKVAESQLYASLQGLSWTPSGDEVWATSPLESGEIQAMSLSGKMRVPFAVPGRLKLQDIAANGRLLAEQGIVRRGMIVARTAGQWQRDLSWLDFGFLRDISRDGKSILFEEEGNENKNYSVYVRNVDGSPATPLGEGYAVAFSRDKQWVLALKLVEPNHELWLYPVGTGEARRLSPPNLTGVNAAMFLSDGKRAVYIARESGRPLRTWIQDIHGGAPRAVTTEGIAGAIVSSDDKWLLAGDVNNNGFVVSIEDGRTEPLPGLNKGDAILGWSADNQIYVASALPDNRTAVHIEKLNPRTGTRTAWRDLETSPIGGIMPEPPIITPDGTMYGFDYRLRLSDLYTISGVR